MRIEVKGHFPCDVCRVGVRCATIYPDTSLRTFVICESCAREVVDAFPKLSPTIDRLLERHDEECA